MKQDGIRADAQRTGAARAAGGGVAVSGVLIGDVVQQPALPVRSGYLQQVHRIAPPELWDRQAELAELATFCRAPDAGPYAWWRAPAWSGKSALMAHFVLAPPPGVRVVPFFVTARLAAQNDRVAFISAVLEQLCDLLAEPLPGYLTEATREAYLLDLLTRAAACCAERGERLVLLVDGLDEDRGVTTGPDAHSIAALLPARPPAGLRLVVAGRPDPPVPFDVPEDHPLRDPAIVRPLTPSAHARTVRADAERELKRLIAGTALEQQLLGLVTAAGGGLSGPDLAALTGASGWEIEEHLRSAAGRTFSRREALETDGGGPPVYLLAHEELQVTARTFLAGRLDGHRDAIHAWADRHRAAGWPPQTPGYLLRGYHRMLDAAGDLPRLTACALDPARHALAAARSGGDAAALAEIFRAQELLSGVGEAGLGAVPGGAVPRQTVASSVYGAYSGDAQVRRGEEAGAASPGPVAPRPEPELAALALLAVRREAMQERNEDLPLGLPAVWAVLGRTARGEQIARSVTDGTTRLEAFLMMVQALVRAGRPDEARAVAAAAEDLALSITDPEVSEAAAAHLVRVLAALGDFARAAAVADGIADRSRSDALADLAEAAAAAGDLARARSAAGAAAELLVRGEGRHPVNRRYIVAGAIRALVAAGERPRARAVAASEEASLTTWLPGRLIRALVSAGADDVAARLARGAARSPYPTDEVGAWIAVGDLVRAGRLAQDIDEPQQRQVALGMHARAVAASGDAARALRLVRDLGDPLLRATSLRSVVERMADDGDLADAERLASEIEDAGERARAFTAVARSVAEAGDAPRATRLALDVEEIVRSPLGTSTERVAELAALATALAGAGDRDRARSALARAERLAGELAEDPSASAEALAAVARAAADLGDRERARAHADAAESSAHQVGYPSWRGKAARRAVEALADAGELRRAEELAVALPELGARPAESAGALALLATAWAKVADRGQTVRLAALAEAAGRATAPDFRAHVLLRLTKALVRAGDRPAARRMVELLAGTAEACDSSFVRDRVQQVTVRACVAIGDLAQGARMAREITTGEFGAGALAVLVPALLDSGERELARECAALAVTAARTAWISADDHVGVLAAAAVAARAAGVPDEGCAEDVYRLPHAIPFARAEALVDLTEGLPGPAARRVLAESMRYGEPGQWLPALARLAPAELGAFADEFVGVDAPAAPG